MALSVKQELFCLEYAKSGNARQAYKSAGYKCRSDDVVDAAASRLLSQVKVKERLAELAEEIKDNSIADIREMQETLTQIIRKQMKEEVIICDPVAGAQTMEKTPSVKEIISAITTLGKMQGAFVEKVEQTVDMDLNITVDYGDDSE